MMSDDGDNSFDSNGVNTNLLSGENEHDNKEAEGSILILISSTTPGIFIINLNVDTDPYFEAPLMELDVHQQEEERGGGDFETLNPCKLCI